MNWRNTRNILVVVGAYAVAEWLAMVITMSGIAGTVYGGAGRLGELWISIRESVPRTAAAATGAVLLWFVLGAVESRRWVWALAGLFAAFGLVDRQFQAAPGVPTDYVSRAIDLAVWCLLPTLGCLVAATLLARFGPRSAQGARPAEPEGAIAPGGRWPLIVVWSVLMILAGGFAGMWITYSMQVTRLAGWTAAALESGQRSQYAYTQYREADYAAAKAALTEFVDYLAALKPSAAVWEPGQAPFLDEKSLAFDKMLTYGRLALVAERARHADEAATYWQRAEQEARAVKWQEPTRDRIRATVVGLDSVNQPSPAKPR